MPTLFDIKENIKNVSALSDLIDAYEEIASIRMKKIRDTVLKNRAYQEDIDEIFQKVRKHYSKEVFALVKKRGKQKRITFIPHNGKSVSVLLSANTGLYGSIVPETYRLFISEARNTQSEITIVGKYGFQLFLSENIGRPYTYFEFPDFGDSEEKMTEIIKHIVQYEEIHVFYGKFKNIVTQTPNMLSVSAKIDLEDKGGEEKTKEYYIFEPSLEKILIFFETQIFSSLFQQTMKESQLSKFASRFVAMDKASTNTKTEIKKMEFLKNKLIHDNFNKKQQNVIAGLVVG